MSFRSPLGFAMLGVAALLPAYASPIHSLEIVDANDSLSMFLDGSLLSGVCFSGPPQCTVAFSLPLFTVSSPLPLNFNIYADAGFTVLTDTLALSSFPTSGGDVGFLLHFHADLDGTPLTPLAGATSILADGTVQTATIIQYSDGLTSDMIQFQSDVPEPSYMALLAVLGLLGYKKSRVGIRTQPTS